MGPMNTCVLCLRRRNDLEWMIRSRSRWKAVRRGDSSCWRGRVASAAFADRGDKRMYSSRSRRSLTRIGVLSVSAIDLGILKYILRNRQDAKTPRRQGFLGQDNALDACFEYWYIEVDEQA